MSHQEIERHRIDYSIPKVNREINPSNKQSIKNNPAIQKQTKETIARTSIENNIPIPAIINPSKRNTPAIPRSVPALSKSFLSDLISLILFFAVFCDISELEFNFLAFNDDVEFNF